MFLRSGGTRYYIAGVIEEHKDADGTYWYAQRLTQKPVGVTLCQFDSDLRNHVFRHEKAL